MKKTLKVSVNYRAANCCSSCFFSDMRMYGGSGVGYFCKKLNTRVAKKNVCDLFAIEPISFMDFLDKVCGDRRKYYGDDDGPQL